MDNKPHVSHKDRKLQEARDKKNKQHQHQPQGNVPVNPLPNPDDESQLNARDKFNNVHPKKDQEELNRGNKDKK